MLNKRREATEAWQTAERKRNDFCEKLKTEPQYISDAIVRVTEAIINCDDLASAAVTGQALSGWRTIEAVWPARRSRLEAAIGELEARIEELQAEEKRHLSREAQLQKDIDGIKRDAQKIIG